VLLYNNLLQSDVITLTILSKWADFAYIFVFTLIKHNMYIVLCYVYYNIYQIHFSFGLIPCETYPKTHLGP
jgi:hypothetical protein